MSLGGSCELREFPDMRHGWTTRGDIRFNLQNILREHFHHRDNHNHNNQQNQQNCNGPFFPSRSSAFCRDPAVENCAKAAFNRFLTKQILRDHSERSNLYRNTNFVRKDTKKEQTARRKMRILLALDTKK